MEDYFTWLLREIPPVKLTPIPGQHGLREDDTKAATFARRKHLFTWFDQTRPTDLDLIL